MDQTKEDLRERIGQLRQGAEMVRQQMLPMQDMLSQRFSNRLAQERTPYGEKSRVDDKMLEISHRLELLSMEFMRVQEELDQLEKMLNTEVK